MRRRARVAPDRRPQHERCGARRKRRGARRGRRSRRRPRRSAGASRATARCGGKIARNGSSARGPAAAVAHVAADQREHHVLALVQRLERADPERRRVVGDEQDRVTASVLGEHLGGLVARDVGAAVEERLGLGDGGVARVGGRDRPQVADRAWRRSRRSASRARRRSRSSGRRGPSPSAGRGTAAARRRPCALSAVTGPISTNRVRRASTPGRRRVTSHAACEANACAGCASSKPNASASAMKRSRKPRGSTTSSSTISSQSASTAPRPARR